MEEIDQIEAEREYQTNTLYRFLQWLENDQGYQLVKLLGNHLVHKPTRDKIDRLIAAYLRQL